MRNYTREGDTDSPSGKKRAEELRLKTLEANVLKIQAQTVKLERENSIAEGRMVARADVVADASLVAVALCQDLQRIPARVAARLVGLDAAEIKHELEVEIAGALDNFRLSGFVEAVEAAKKKSGARRGRTLVKDISGKSGDQKA